MDPTFIKIASRTSGKKRTMDSVNKTHRRTPVISKRDNREIVSAESLITQRIKSDKVMLRDLVLPIILLILTTSNQSEV